MSRFVDRVVVHATAGSGGNGCASVHREKFKPLGGPDGGNGGSGGDVVLVVDPQVHTLLDFHFRPHARAGKGEPGMGANRNGAQGDDLVLAVPPGTVVLDQNGELLADLVPNHLVAVRDPHIPEELVGRAMLVRDLQMLPFECVARGYLSGSALVDYRATGAVCGVALPPGLVESEALPEPIFTPATKAEFGRHDENVSYEVMAAKVGADRAAELREVTLAVYARAAAHAQSRGILLADTKFEFGLDHVTGRLVLADEVLTPDSSRFWPAAGYRAGGPQPSFDKQFVRDWLTSPASGWDRASDSPPPPLPESVISATRARYVEAYETISGRSFADWPGGA